MDTPASPALDAETASRLIKSLEKAIEDRDHTIKDMKYENSEMRDQHAQLQIEYETRIETLQAELSEIRMGKTELEHRFQDAKEQLTELHGNEHEINSARKERHDAILQLQRMEQENLRMVEEIGTLRNENEQVRANLKEAQSNLTTLQTTLVTMKKQKHEVDSKFSKYMYDQRAREEALNMEIEDLEAQLEAQTKQNESLRQNVFASEQEKAKMQSEFTAATMDLLTEDLNASNDKHAKQGTMRLSAITSEDMRKRGSGRERADSQASVDSGYGGMHLRNESVQYAGPGHRIGGSIAVQDGGSLLQQMGRLAHERGDSQLSIDSSAGGGGHRRQLSVGATSDAVLQKLRVFMSRELIGQIKAMLGEELRDLDMRDHIEKLGEKVEQIVKKVANGGAGGAAGGGDLSEESLAALLGQLEQKVKKSLEETLNKMNENGSNVEQIRNALSASLDELSKKLERPSDSMKTVFEDTLRDQMEAMQVSMENQIDSSINNSIQQSMSQHVGSNVASKVEASINASVKEPLESINETVEKIYELQRRNGGGGGGNSGPSNNVSSVGDKEEYNKVIEELGHKMESLLNNNNVFEESMQDRIDKFMETFRHEVIPEFQAMFEQMDLSNIGASRRGGTADDEKYDENRNKYEVQIDGLKDKVVQLEKLVETRSRELKDAATSKAGSLLRLQNLIDHLRFDNRVLQQKLDRYRLQDAIYDEMDGVGSGQKQSWMGSIMGGVMSMGGFGRSQPKVIHVNVRNVQEVQNNEVNEDYDDYQEWNQSAGEVAEYTANAAVNVVARAVAAGANGQNVST